MTKVKVVIADGQPLMLKGMRRVLELAGDIEVAGEAQTGTEVLDLVRRFSPDVVLLDTRLPVSDGTTCLDVLRARYPAVKVLVVSNYGDADHVERALRRGAAGYIVKSVNPLDLPAAVRQAHEGTVYHTIARPNAGTDTNAKAAGLTERETSILGAVARGLSNQAIAAELFVTEQTVKFHLTNVYRKLGVANRTDAVRHAYQHGLIELPTLETS